MGINATLLGHNETTGKVEDILSTQQAIHVYNPYDPALASNISVGPTSRTFFSMFGRAPDVDDVLQSLWAGPTVQYVFPSTAQQMRIVSTSASDAAAGIGARTIRIHYLDASFVEKETTVTMNGITPVNTTVTDIYRINYMHVDTKGSNLTAVGAISLTDLAGTVTYAFLEASTNSARQGVYTVPAGKSAYITHWQCSSGSTGSHFCQVRMVSNTHNGTLLPNVLLVQDEQGTQNGGMSISFSTPLLIPATADIALFAVSDNAAANVIALGGVMGYLETN